MTVMTSLRSPFSRQIHRFTVTVSSTLRSGSLSNSQTHSAGKGQLSLTRRRLVEGALSLNVVVPILQSTAPACAEETLISYKDPSLRFSLSYPGNWTMSDAQSMDNEYVAEQTLVWYPKDVPPGEVNITLLINRTGADFTKLRSFGSAEDFGTNLVNSMDQRYLLRGYRRSQEKNQDVQTANLVSAKNQKRMYSIEYLLKKPNEEQKRLLSLVALNFDGTYNRLYTLTAQCVDAEYAKYQGDIQIIMDSFRPPGDSV